MNVEGAGQAPVSRLALIALALALVAGATAAINSSPERKEEIR